jgi:PAS domain S-box-containing protein
MPEASTVGSSGFTKRYACYFAAGWTVLILASLFWSSRRTHENHMDKARTEARTLYETNLAYRVWSSSHGGVYVPVTDALRPNPYLHVPDRDVLTIRGKKFTLVNPAWMSRQVFETLRAQSSLPVLNHITSLKFLNPVNKPDPWEERALRAFEQGVPEVSEMQLIGAEPYMRLMKPFITQESCLKCHRHQGYKAGDVRGGMSIAIPMRSHLLAETREKKTAMATHALFWLIGMGGIFLFTRNMEGSHRKLAESEENYRLLFENNPHPMWVYDLETCGFLTVNDAAVDHYGYSREEFLSMTIKDIRPQEDIPKLMKNISGLGTGIDHAGMWRHRKKDGTVIFVEITSHVLNFAGRRAELVMVNDVSDRKRLEDQLRHSQKMEAVGLLAGGVAHDFNNILTAIIGYSSLMKMKLKVDDPLLHSVDEVMGAAERGAVLTQSLLTFSRKQIINPRPLNINNVIARVGGLLLRLIGEDIKLELLQSKEQLTVIADSGQLEQVLMNLATNARDSMPDGGYLTIETGRVTIDEEFIAAHSYGKPGSYALMTISDTGMGMEAKTAERIFEPFFTTKEMGRGTGLGLSIVYGIVKQHDGFINVYSEPSRGTSFRIYLPLAQPALAEEAALTRTEPALRRGSETILVAEDDVPLRRLVRTALEEFGYRVIEAVDGEDALNKILEHGDRIKLLLLDVVMPKRNGKEVYEEAKKSVPGIRALFVSGYTADIVHKKGILDEHLHFLSKPVSPYDLLKKVRDVLDRDV